MFCLTEGGDLIVVRATPERFDQVAEIPLVGEPPAPGAEKPKLLNYPAWAAPILAHGLLYVRGSDRLVCIELTRDGAGP